MYFLNGFAGEAMESDGSSEESINSNINNNNLDETGRDSIKRKNDLDSTEMDDEGGIPLTSLKRIASSDKNESHSTTISSEPSPNISVGPPFQTPPLLPYLYPPGLYPGTQGLAGLSGLMLPSASSTSLGPPNLPLPLLGTGSSSSSRGSSTLSPPTSIPMAHNLLLAHNLLAAGAGQHLLGAHSYQALAGLTGLGGNVTSIAGSASTTRNHSSTALSSPATSISSLSPHLADRLKPSRFAPYISSGNSIPSLSSVLCSSLSSISSPLTSSLFTDSHLGVSSAFQAVSPKGSGSSRLDEARRTFHSNSVASELKSIEKMVNGLDRRPPQELPESIKIADK